MSKVELVHISHMLKVNGTQGFKVPFLGYVELDAGILGKQFCGLGFLIARDPINTTVAARKMAVPRVIGSNIFIEMRTGMANVNGTELNT